MAINELIEELRARRLKEVSEKKVHRKESPKKEITPVEEDSDSIRAAVYKKIIERYSETLGLLEEKTIPELKVMINPENQAIDGVKQSILDSIKGQDAAWEYSFERDFPSFMKKALEFCFSLKPVNADLSISYWLKPEEIVELKAADPFDKAIFLCSLVKSAGGSAKVRVLELDGNAKHAVVLVGDSGKEWLLDPSCSSVPEEGGTEEDVLQKHVSHGSRVLRSLYEFSDQEYSSFDE